MSGPIKHIVMWRLRGDTPAEQAAARTKVKTPFEGLRAGSTASHTSRSAPTSAMSITPAT